jgi:hypothetical protein
VLDSGQVTGLDVEEIFQTLILLFYIATTLTPQAELTIEKVRLGHEGFSLMLKVTKEIVTTDKNFTKELLVM